MELSKKIHPALRTALICGFAGMMVDMDHIPYYILGGNIQIFSYTYHVTSGRIFHDEILYISGCIAMGIILLISLDILIMLTLGVITKAVKNMWYIIKDT
ncbi:hypothetical protein CUJ83_07840 [Methanocella sp. CWC-04]|uniref:Uncharacterized protein n=1 Tax=Methanooceanicella nereidis TaxID=2052831 RepID=A0AAP2RD43_9EURY|nr:hypothetical protein [Methanocella sp. CWC-04]MCD1294907.1 hypothetical protein [Methanocella sp. CWC-04]